MYKSPFVPNSFCGIPFLKNILEPVSPLSPLIPGIPGIE